MLMDAIVKIDKEGRINLPLPMLNALRVPAPGELHAHASTGKLELTAVHKSAAIRFVEENGVLVAANATEFDAVAAVQAVRDERL